MLLFYASQKNKAVEMLKDIILQRLPIHQAMFCKTVDAMEKQLRRPGGNLDILLVSVRDTIEMAEMARMSPLFLDTRLILVLPRRDDTIVIRAHKLGPRFIAYRDNGLEQVASVLDKMLSNIRRSETIEEHEQLK